MAWLLASATLLAPLCAEAASNKVDVSIAGTALNIVTVDSSASGMVVVRTEGARNIANVKQDTTGSAAFFATMIGSRNEANIDSRAGGQSYVGVTQTDRPEPGAVRSKDGWSEGISAGGDYITVYQNGAFGLVELATAKPARGFLGRR
jgi:hypothetical protein